MGQTKPRRTGLEACVFYNVGFIIIQVLWDQQIMRWPPLKRQYTTHSSQEKETYYTMQGHMEKYKGGSGVEEVGRNMGKNLSYGFHGGWGDSWGRSAGLAWASINFSMLWDVVVILGCLVPGLVVIKADDYWGLRIRRDVCIWGGWVLSWLVCIWRVQHRWVVYSRNWLALGGAVSLPSVRPQMSTSELKKKKKKTYLI